MIHYEGKVRKESNPRPHYHEASVLPLRYNRGPIFLRLECTRFMLVHFLVIFFDQCVYDDILKLKRLKLRQDDYFEPLSRGLL